MVGLKILWTVSASFNDRFWGFAGLNNRFLDVVWNRPNFHSSPAVATALDMCLNSSGMGKDDMDLFDFYS